MGIRAYLIKKLTKKPVISTNVGAEESSSVRALKRQIRVLEEINFTYEDNIKNMSKALNRHREESLQEKMIDIAKEFLLPGSKAPQQTQLSEPQATYNRVAHTDAEIKDMLSEVNPDLLKIGVERGAVFCKQFARNKYPNLDEDSLNRAFTIAKEMVTQ